MKSRTTVKEDSVADDPYDAEMAIHVVTKMTVTHRNGLNAAIIGTTSILIQ